MWRIRLPVGRWATVGTYLPPLTQAPGIFVRGWFYPGCKPSKEITMPIILWLLGVPLALVLLLMLFGVI